MVEGEAALRQPRGNLGETAASAPERDLVPCPGAGPG